MRTVLLALILGVIFQASGQAQCCDVGCARAKVQAARCCAQVRKCERQAERQARKCCRICCQPVKVCCCQPVVCCQVVVSSQTVEQTTVIQSVLPTPAR